MAGVPPVPGGATFRSPAFGRATLIGADRGTDAAAVPAAAGPAGLVLVTRIGAVSIARFRAAESLRIPARGVIAQVVVDISGVAPKAPVGRRAAMPRRACVAEPNVKVISFAAHAPSLLVARKSPVIGVRPLPERRAPLSR
jgi:hypothetical protein